MGVGVTGRQLAAAAEDARGFHSADGVGSAPASHAADDDPAPARALHSVAQGVRSASAVLDRLRVVASGLPGIASATAFLRDPVSGDLHLVRNGSPGDTSHGPGVNALQSPALHLCLASSEVVRCEASEKGFLATILPRDVVSHALCLPVVSESSDIAGALLVAGQGDYPPPEVVTLLRLLARDAAVTMNAGSRPEPSEHAAKIVSLISAIADVGPQAPLEELKRALVDVCRAPLGTDLVALITIDPLMGGLDCQYSSAVGPELQSAFVRLFDARIADASPQSVWVERRSDRHDCANTTDDQVAGTFLTAPIRSGVGVNGALMAFYPGNWPVDGTDTALAEIVGAEASLALSYAMAIDQSTQLMEGLAGENRELSLQATRDGLTGLANHRSLQQTLSDLCRVGASCRQRVFSLVMIDVDHFKVYNDSYGHREGDAALRHVAKLVSSGLRQKDVAARYGGEEFALVLRGVGKDAAQAVADRIRRQVADQSCPKGPLTISLGVAEFPADGSTPGEIIERADRALYQAKITGRNRVVVWGSSDFGPHEEESDADQDTAHRSILVLECASDRGALTLKEVLSFQPCRITVSTDVASAMSSLTVGSFDIAFVSETVVSSSDLTPLSTLSAIHPGMPVVYAISNPSVGISREALRKGASDILLMPCRPAELSLVIERNLERRRIEQGRLHRRSVEIVHQAIDALVAAIDARDPNAAEHSQQVTALSVTIGGKLKLSNEDRESLELAARLHDVGKLALPGTATANESSLTDDDWRAMREHPALGSRIVGAIDELSYVSSVIRHHHERLDGSGYPDRIAGSTIPFLSQVIAVADAYESMTSSRARHGNLSPREALDELRMYSGTHYNPVVIDALEDALAESGAICRAEAA
jgi:diguanylate cyclase (GGDEF)-like protein